MRWLNRRKRRVLVIGLDCASPQLVFDQFRADLPHLAQLMAGGTWGVLESCVPCITVPAWASMFSSRDPGVLGVYGFRNRTDYSYQPMTVASGSDVRVPRVWDTLSAAGKTSLVAAVPQTFPVRPLNGHLVAGYPASSLDSAFTYPAMLRTEVLKHAPRYPFDISDFRTEDKAALVQRLLDFTEQQYTVLRHLLSSKPWDFAAHVNLGVDRVQHGFWRYHDPLHRLYTPGNPFENTIREYYKLVDAQIGAILALAGDDTTILVVSDHGVKRMDGAICLNEWLWRNGWLALKQPPAEGQIIAFDEQNVDWSHTRAWGSGGYYGRVWLNVAGREPQGIVPNAAYQATCDELSAALCAIPAPDGTALMTRAFQPKAIYQQVNGVAPDLLVYFGDLHWRSVGGLGYGAYHTLENDTGPDDANHAPEGMFIVYDPHQRGGGSSAPHQLMDIAPTVLSRLGVPIPDAMQGQAF
ncbi:MAG: alkaline phosphatase family protein [Armatimonadetes bacterium]|nr:alkaline phosphatase family protein [Anaerolineae bacterium]